MSSHSFTVDGTRQVYHVAGTGPIMITHPGGPGVDYAYLRSPRLEERFTMVYPEPVGTGESGPLPEGATYVDTYAHFLAALVDHLGAPRVHLLGHSHGGFVALRYALDHPDRVAGLALYSSSPTTAPEFWESEQAEAIRYVERHAGIPEVAGVRDALGEFDRVRTDEDKTRVLSAAMPVYFADFWGDRRAEYEAVRAGLRAWVTTFEEGDFEVRPELDRIVARTVVITGRHDFICGPRWAEMLHQGIPGSRLVILENSGHFAQIEEPDAFVQAVTWLLGDFADEVRATFRRGDSAAVVKLAEAEIERARAAGEPAGEVEGLYALGRVAIRGGDLPRAAELARTALDVAVRAGDRRLEERPRHVLAAVTRMSGDFAGARDLYLASIALNEELGQPEMVNSEYHNLAFAELHLGNVGRARELFEAGRERVFREGYDSFVPYVCVAAAALASAEGDHPRAARMAALADGAFAALGQVPDPDDAEELANVRAAATADLGEERFEQEYAAGAALTPREAFTSGAGNS